MTGRLLLAVLPAELLAVLLAVLLAFTASVLSAEAVTRARAPMDLLQVAAGTIFVDDFEAGGTSAWSDTIGLIDRPRTVTFDDPVPPGSPNELIEGVFEGLDLGTGQWRWTGPFGPDATNSIYFSENVSQRTFSFSQGSRALLSFAAYTSGVTGTLTVTDDAGQQLVRTLTAGSVMRFDTGWTAAAGEITVAFTGGFSMGLDDITFGPPGPPDTEPPSVSITSPTPGATVSGVLALVADAIDNVGVVGVAFSVDGTLIGEDRSPPYAIGWDSASVVEGAHEISAAARDAAGNSATAQVAVTVEEGGGGGAGFALRFFGNGVDDIDRVKIRIDDPELPDDPGPPVDIGATDFTIELWLRALPGENMAQGNSCSVNSWIEGNIVVDRDRFGQPRAYGLSISDRRLVFGIDAVGGSVSICGAAIVDDGIWHHVAIQRSLGGAMSLYVDGVLDAIGTDPGGDVSYPDDGIPGPFCSGAPCTNSDPFIVLAAEKHDAGSDFPSFSGWLDELRFSDILRYSGNAFPRPTAPFTTDGATVGLYHFDEGLGDVVGDTSGAPGGPSAGERRFGGSPTGPLWVVSDLPF